MRDIKVYYQPIDGDRTDLAIFSKHGESDIFEEQLSKVIEEQELSRELYSMILGGMYSMFREMTDELEIQRWMDCYVQETRMEWI